MTAVIPRPTSHTAQPGRLRSTGPWHVTAADPALEPVAAVAAALLAPHLSVSATTAHADTPVPPRTLTLTLGAIARGPEPVGQSPQGDVEPVDESYELVVAPHGIDCRARTPEGAFRAATTAIQLIAAAPGGELGCGIFHDAPRYAWRGLMLDPARGYLAPDELRRLIDLAALYKLNVLHLHLTDNEAWRLQLLDTPQLSAPGTHGTPWYTADEYRDLQEYAATRFVTVVPEIDLPGHSAALRAALPDLADAPMDDRVREFLGRLEGLVPFAPPLDLADDATHDVVARILKEVCALTVGPYVHIGADEALGMTDENYAVAVQRLRDIVLASGRQPLAWQEASRAGVRPADILQFWTRPSMMDAAGTQAAAALGDIFDTLKELFAPTEHDLARIVAAGGRVILSPQSHLYLDRPYDPSEVPEGQQADGARLGFPLYPPSTVRRTASWRPDSHGVPEANIAGIEATLFGETVEGMHDACVLLLPRLPGIAETAWAGNPAEWDEYQHRLAAQAVLWDARGLHYMASRHVPWPTAGHGA
ncbi:family 20 glycosylhydrolase [Yinghuangia seranimata]|uniref:family 20 glycosylhydrolase n=1 Tax=Yinghuangia seranimata TaxID=408067 RepID=UPI00248CE01E|nr:family 20 glycosylhydrolase [Yinghuangia seranimata]MDI2130120.1 family 20 glycosylhydrolase [Yinghuangia seranimata]